MTQEQYQKFLDILQSKFGRNPYFERRNGKTLLTPEEQAVILEALRKVGIKDEHKFDSYIEAAKIVKQHGLMSPHNKSTSVLVVRGLLSS